MLRHITGLHNHFVQSMNFFSKGQRSYDEFTMLTIRRCLFFFWGGGEREKHFMGVSVSNPKRAFP